MFRKKLCDPGESTSTRFHKTNVSGLLPPGGNPIAVNKYITVFKDQMSAV
jgi:hypothetical protein